MRSPSDLRKHVAFIVLVMMAVFLVLPAPASSKEKRGAQLVVTKLDGREVGGELIAVKDNSLLLLDGAGGDEAVNATDIRTIKIVRKSHAGGLAIGGALVGALGGLVIISSVADEDNKYTAPLGGVLFGAAGALAGLALSVPIGADTTFALAGEPGSVVRERLNKLARMSREARTSMTQGPIDPAFNPVIPKALAISLPRDVENDNIVVNVPALSFDGKGFRLAFSSETQGFSLSRSSVLEPGLSPMVWRALD